MSKRALLVVDMLKDFIDSDGALTCGEEAQQIIPFVLDKVKEFVAQGQPIIFIMDAHDPEDLEFKRFPRHCIFGTTGARLIDPLAALVEEYSFAMKVLKNRYSGFFRTNLNEILRDLEPVEIEVVGVCTNICVLYTVEELCNRDYNVIVHSKGVASFDQEAHEWALRQMDSVLGARVS